MNCARAMLTVVSLMVLLPLSGCGGTSGGPQLTPGEPGKLEDLVRATAENWAKKPEFDDLFAQGASELYSSWAQQHRQVSTPPGTSR